MAFQPQSDYCGVGAQTSFPPQTPISSSMAERKSSIAVSNGGFVSPNHDWHDMPLEAKHVPDAMNDLALGAAGPMDGSHFKTEQGWTPPHHSFNQPGDFDPLMSEYSGANHNGMGMQFDPSHTGPPSAAGMQALPNQGQFSLSPQSQPWMTPVGEAFDFSPLAPQGTRQTPVFATSTSVIRRDGVRKKNARFDIPAERNLRTIDQLIAQTSDEGEIKELKQQKRLLRNRQAALDSRQRKKQHTERLEEREKHYMNMISDMEEDAKAHEDQWLRRQEEWMQRQAQFQQWIQTLQSEKEQTIQHYSTELNELRRQNAILLQQVHKDSASMSASGSTGIPGEFTDFEQLTIQSNPWENFPMQNEFSLESDHSTESTLATPGKNSNTIAKRDDKSPASGLILMLLLCGAWVVSKGSTDTKELLPTMPEDLRAASATVIEDLYKGSGIHLPESDLTSSGPSSTNTARNPQQRGSASFDAGVDNYGLDANTHPHALGHAQRDTFSSSSSNIQTMANMLRDAMRSVKAQSPPAAETYTKSLLADKVPGQVLKDFAQMIAHKRPPKHDSNVPAQLLPTYD